ncbi:MAG: kinase [Clostridiales bacterium]|nr:kinase [Clostridiales bacterium]
MATTPLVVCIGAANVDINGFSTAALLPEESNPGHIRLCAGGVARNIAENLARLGNQVELISALGGDGLQRLIIDSCKAAGIGYAHCAADIAQPSSSYLAILDERGEMALAVCDMGITDRLITPAFLEREAALLEQAALIVADAGLLRPTLAWLCGRFAHKDLFLDPVSIRRCANVKGLLPHFHTLKMNGHEAAHLAGFKGSPTREDYLAMAEGFTRRGNSRIFITLGPLGAVYAAQGQPAGWLPAVPLQPKGVTGAGDAFMAGVVHAHLRGWTAAEAARFATGVSAVALSSPLTVNPKVSERAALDLLKTLPG